MRMSDWRPIETAPRIPYEKLDLWVVPANAEPFRAANAHCSGNLKHWLDSKGYYLEGRKYWDDGDRCNDPDDRGPEATIVTHWMPLPPPPAEVVKLHKENEA